jgi:hypothetical protein
VHLRRARRAVDLLAAVAAPLAVEVFRVFFVLGLEAHHDVALANAALVLLGTLFRDPGADERAEEAAANGAGGAAGECGRDRPHRDEADAGQRDRPCRREGGENRAEAAADGRAHAGAFRGLAPQLGVRRAFTEVAATRFVGHEQVDVVAPVAAARQRSVRTLRALAIPEHAGEHARPPRCARGAAMFSH